MLVYAQSFVLILKHEKARRELLFPSSNDLTNCNFMCLDLKENSSTFSISLFQLRGAIANIPQPPCSSPCFRRVNIEGRRALARARTFCSEGSMKGVCTSHLAYYFQVFFGFVFVLILFFFTFWVCAFCCAFILCMSLSVNATSLPLLCRVRKQEVQHDSFQSWSFVCAAIIAKRCSLATIYNQQMALQDWMRVMRFKSRCLQGIYALSYFIGIQSTKILINNRVR